MKKNREYPGPAAAAANYSFDNLFVPFRCSAANIEENRGEVMMDGGMFIDFSLSEMVYLAGYEAAIVKISENLHLFDHRMDEGTLRKRREAFRREMPALMIDQVVVTGELRLGMPAGQKGTLEAGGIRSKLRYTYYDSDDFSKTDENNITWFTPWIGYLRFERSSLNRKQYSTSGSLLTASIKYVNGREKYQPAEADRAIEVLKDHSWWELSVSHENYLLNGHRFSPGYTAELFLSDRSLLSNYTSSLGLAKQFNPLPLAQTRFLPEFRASNYLAAGLKAAWSVSRSTSLRAEAYALPGPRDRQLGVHDKLRVYLV